MTNAQYGPSLIGETVTVSYVADPSVGHGRFRLENHGADEIMASVKSAWLELGGHRQALSGVTLFDIDQDQTMNAEGFKLDGKTTVTFLVGFPEIVHEPRFGESSALGLQLRIDDAELQALSPLKFVRRIPYRR